MIDAADRADGPTGQTVLVTGGAGFIGSHIAEALTADNEVRLLDDLSSGSRTNVPDGATLFEGDLRSSESLAAATEGVDVIFHEAALVSVEESVDRPVYTDDMNVDATLSVLEAARRESARFVFASSAAVYGKPESVPISEDAPTRPTSPYGVSKLAADQYARVYAELYDVPTAALRYFNVYGPGQSGGDYSGVIDAFFEQALSGEPLTIHGDGSQTRDFVHIDDVVQANLLAATTDNTGQAFNVGTGRSITIRELAETIVDVTDSRSDIEYVEGRQNDIPKSCADISRAEAELDYQPTVSTLDGLRSLVDQYEVPQ